MSKIFSQLLRSAYGRNLTETLLLKVVNSHQLVERVVVGKTLTAGLLVISNELMSISELEVTSSTHYTHRTVQLVEGQGYAGSIAHLLLYFLHSHEVHLAESGFKFSLGHLRSILSSLFLVFLFLSTSPLWVHADYTTNLNFCQANFERIFKFFDFFLNFIQVYPKKCYLK